MRTRFAIASVLMGTALARPSGRRANWEVT